MTNWMTVIHGKKRIVIPTKATWRRSVHEPANFAVSAVLLWSGLVLFVLIVHFVVWSTDDDIKKPTVLYNVNLI